MASKKPNPFAKGKGKEDPKDMKKGGKMPFPPKKGK